MWVNRDKVILFSKEVISRIRGTFNLNVSDLTYDMATIPDAGKLLFHVQMPHSFGKSYERLLKHHISFERKSNWYDDIKCIILPYFKLYLYTKYTWYMYEEKFRIITCSGSTADPKNKSVLSSDCEDSPPFTPKQASSWSSGWSS